MNNVCFVLFNKMFESEVTWLKKNVQKSNIFLCTIFDPFSSLVKKDILVIKKGKNWCAQLYYKMSAVFIFNWFNYLTLALSGFCLETKPLKNSSHIFLWWYKRVHKVTDALKIWEKSMQDWARYWTLKKRVQEKRK